MLEDTLIEVTEEEKLETEKLKAKTELKQKNMGLFGIIIAGIIIMLFAFGFKSKEMTEALEDDEGYNYG